MILHFFEPSKHLHYLHTWLDIRGLDHSFTTDLPLIGFIGMEGTAGLVAAFFRRVEPNYGMVDSLITNPTLEPARRDKAVDEISRHILELARAMKIVRIIGFTRDEHTELRAHKFGFKTLNAKMVMLDL